MEPTSPIVEAWSLNHWTTREVPVMITVVIWKIPVLVLCDNLEGWSGEGGGRGFRTEGTHAYLWLIHTDVWQNHDNSVK